MRAFEAYRQSQNVPVVRIDVILELYQIALESLERAQRALNEHDQSVTRAFLLKSQTAVMGLASGLPAYRDEMATNFVRLYEYASYQMTQATAESITAATQVLRTLYEGFQKIREEATSLERHHRIPPLGHDHFVSVKA